LNDPQPQLRRVLGLTDLSLFLIAALVNLNSIPVVAGAGPSALLFWLVGFTLFFIPQAIAVLELSNRFPGEGGIYIWSKKAFGYFHGFISGWCYWTNNIFYIPTLLFYIVGFGVFIGGSGIAGLGDNLLFMVVVSLFLLWTITGLNIRGLGVGKWIQNLGAIGTFTITAMILMLGAISFRMTGMANPVNASTLFPAFTDWRSLSLLSIVCLNYVGLELGSVLGDEIKDPLRNIPRAALVAGIATVTMYLLTTAALQAAVPANEIGVIDGILQAVKRVATKIDLPWILTPIALLMTMNATGNTSAWLAGSARIPFVIGLDRYLPAALGRIHPRYCTPHVALVVQGLASSLFIVINAIGSSVHDMYMSLLQTTVVLQLIPYLYMFGALVKVRAKREVFGSQDGFFRKTWICYVAGVLGVVMTAAGIGLAFVPPNGVVDPVWFELKIVFGALSFIIPAVIIFWWKNRRARLAVVPQVEVAPD
jgi:amino acid transporter